MLRRWIVVAGIASTVLVSAVALAQELPELPDFLPADQQVPVATPAEGEQVLVVQVALRSDGERVTAEIRSQEIVNTFAPKVVARSAGEWEVRLTGERELSFLIPNPLLDVEVENPDDPNSPYDTVPTESLDWTLVVPLYDEAGQPLGATSVEVLDVTTREVILQTDVAEQRPG